MPGYYELVATVTNQNHPEKHAEMTEWIGRPCDDSTEFDIGRVNTSLSDIKL